MALPAAGGILLALPVVLEARSQKIGPMVWPFMGLAVGRSLSAVIALIRSVPMENPQVLLYVLTGWTGVAAALYAERRPDQVRPALRWMAVPLAVVAAVQALPYMQNTFINRSLLGMAFVPVLAAYLGSRWVIVPALGLALTVSRGAILSSLAMAGWFYALLPLAIPATLAAFPVLMALRNSRSINIHLMYNLAGWYGFLEAPLLGLGPDRLGYFTPTGHAHNVILDVASWSGLMGLGLLGWGLWRARSAWAALPRWAQAGIIGLGLAGLVDDWTLHPIIMAMAGAIAAGEVKYRPKAGLHD